MSDSHHLPLCSSCFRGCLYPSSLVFVSNNKCHTCFVFLFFFFYSFCILETFLLSNMGKSQGHFLLASGPWWSDRGTPGFHPGCSGLVPGQGAKMCLQDGSLLSLRDPLVRSLLCRSPPDCWLQAPDVHALYHESGISFPASLAENVPSLPDPLHLQRRANCSLSAASTLSAAQVQPWVLTPWNVPPRPTPGPPGFPPTPGHRGP